MEEERVEDHRVVGRAFVGCRELLAAATRGNGAFDPKRDGLPTIWRPARAGDAFELSAPIAPSIWRDAPVRYRAGGRIHLTWRAAWKWFWRDVI